MKVGGGGGTDTYTIRLNGVGTAAAVTIAGAAVVGAWAGSVGIAVGDKISLQFTTDGATAATDITVALEYA